MRFLLGAGLGGVLHVVLVTGLLTVGGLLMEGTRHLGELIAFMLIAAVITLPVGLVLGAVAGALSPKHGAGVITAIGAGLGFAGAGVVSLWLVKNNVGLIPIALAVGAITGALLMGATAKVFSMTRPPGGTT